MNRCARSLAPALLRKHGGAVTTDYLEKRRANSAHQFRWPNRDGQSLYEVVRDAAREMTQGRCAYCDAYPVTAAGKEEVDHFRPKSQPEFYRLVCDWDNLFFTCSACNGSKQEKWDERLLKPDAFDYVFERYFWYEAESGKLIPHPAAKPEDQARAICTITILGLNREGACLARKREAKRMVSLQENEVADAAYRFLIPLCVAT